MKVKFWGTRGSIPCSGSKYNKYGGSTTCVQIGFAGLTEDRLIIIDSGSGIRELAMSLLQTQHPLVRGEGKALIFLSHFHWDHIQGFPFFFPAFINGNEVRFVGRKQNEPLIEVIKGQQKDLYFPVPVEAMNSDIEDLIVNPMTDVGILHEDGFGIINKLIFRRVQKTHGTIRVNKQIRNLDELIRVDMLDGNHPGGVILYRFHAKGKSFAFVTDNEPYADLPVDLIKFCDSTDLLVVDAQYSRETYFKGKGGWGHGYPEYALDLAIRSGCKRLGLTHHDPAQTDDEINENKDKVIKQMYQDKKSAGEAHQLEEVFTCYDGLELEL